MTAALIVTWLAAAGFGLAAPVLLRQARPSHALWVASAGGLLLATTTTATLVAAVIPWVGRQRPVASLDGWPPAALGQPVPPSLVLVVGALLAVAASGLLWVAAADGRRLLAAWRLAARSSPGLVVTGGADPLAYALPGWPGRIVVSRALLRQLDAGERRALLAHERAHLRQRHDLHVLAARLAAGANPLLWGLPGAVRAAAERQADEYAAVVVGDRRTVAHAIAGAAGVRPAPVSVLAAGGADVPRRVAALLAPAAPNRLVGAGRVGVPLLLVGLACVSALLLAHRLDLILDLAQTAAGR